ncbi:MAG: hypothetical protein WCO98_01220 [bacterium]
MVNVDKFKSVEEIEELIAQLRTRKKNLAKGGNKLILRKIATLLKKRDVLMVKVANIDAEIAELKVGKTTPKVPKVPSDPSAPGKRRGRPKKESIE